MNARTRTLLTALLGVAALTLSTGAAAWDDPPDRRWGHSERWGGSDGWRHSEHWNPPERWQRHHHHHHHHHYRGGVTPWDRAAIYGVPGFYAPPVYYAPPVMYDRPYYRYPGRPSVVIDVDFPPIVIR